MRRASTQLPFSFRLLNIVGAVLGITRLAGLQLEADSLLREAPKQTEPTEFGDPGFMEDFKVLLASAEREPKLHLVTSTWRRYE